jgi:hypothetical protein
MVWYENYNTYLFEFGDIYIYMYITHIYLYMYVDIHGYRYKQFKISNN